MPGEPHYRTLDETIAVAGQITPDQVAAVADAGFRTIVCARPDHEEPGQPTFAEIAAAARAAGLEAVHIPVSGWVGEDQVSRMRQVLADLALPVFSYCRSGARSAALYEAAAEGAG
jgi:uncharacterized protein (TIGR01244 family)